MTKRFGSCTFKLEWAQSAVVEVYIGSVVVELLQVNGSSGQVFLFRAACSGIAFTAGSKQIQLLDRGLHSI
jgi:hypothetical protein